VFRKFLSRQPTALEIWEAFEHAGIEVCLVEYGHHAVRLLKVFEYNRMPLIVHFHGADAFARHLVDEKEYRRLFGRADAIIGVSTDMISRLQMLGASPEKLHFNPYGVDLRRFSVAQPGTAGPVCLSVGRFVEKKAPHLTLSAFAKAAADNKAARLVMLGDGPLLDATRKLARALRLDHRVLFPGALPHDQVAAWMGRVRVFIQHSVVATDGDAEGTPVSVLEAQASGLPVVATRHMGIKDVVIEGDTGLLCNEGDVACMAEDIRRLLEEPQTADEMGAKARQRVAAHFSIEQRIGTLGEIIRGVAPQ
jgi:glycosyltransferase involved in cell wall biosynthesis